MKAKIYPTVVIPYSQESSDAYSMIRAFIKDFIVELRNIFVLGGSKKPDMWKIDALRLKYLWEGSQDNPVLSNKEIARIVGCTPENVRKQIEDVLASALVRCLETGENYCGLTPSVEIQRIFADLEKNLKPVEFFPLLQKRVGVHEEDWKTLMLFLHGLDYFCSTNDDTKGLCISKAKFGRQTSELIKKAAKLKKYFKEDPRPLKYDLEVLPYMRSKMGWKDEECKQMEAYLRADSDEYEWGLDSLGTSTIALRWESLGGVDNQTVRILFDYGENNPSNPYMGKEELRKEYNRRALANGIDELLPNWSVNGKNKHIEQKGNGLYRYVNGAKKARADFHEVLKSFVAQNAGKVSPDEAIAFAQVHHRGESTVRQYLTEIDCELYKNPQNGLKYYVHTDYVDLYPNLVPDPMGESNSGKGKRALSPKTILLRKVSIEQLLQADAFTMTKKALYDAVVAEYQGKSPNNLYKIFQGLADEGVFIMDGSTKGGSYRLDIARYNEINGLNDGFDWGLLKRNIAFKMAFCPLVDEKVVERMHAIMVRSAIPDFDKSNEMWRILKLLDTYLNGKSTDEETELLIYKLLIGLEKYLKLFKYYPNVRGLGIYINHLQAIGVFPQAPGVAAYSPGNASYEIQGLNGWVISTRNKICHDLNEEHNNPKYYEDTVKKALKYYLLVAAYDMGN